MVNRMHGYASIVLNRLVADWLELILWKLIGKNVTPPIMILGAPRSGTTMVYAALSALTDCGYFTNSMASVWGAPLLGAVLRRKRCPREALKAASSSSDYGSTSGSLGPSEGGDWISRFFAPLTEPNSSGPPPTGRDVDRFLISATLIQMVVKRPLLIKNLHLVNRLTEIADAGERLLIIHVTRDLDANIQSLLRGRRERGAGVNAWFSVWPLTAGGVSELGPESQVERQIQKINEQIISAGKSPNVTVVRIAYERFCSDPLAEMPSVDALRSFGINLRGDAVAIAAELGLRSNGGESACELGEI